MCHGIVMTESSTPSPSVALSGHGRVLSIILLFSFLPEALLSTVCPQPSEPENGGFLCHPSPCKESLTTGSVIEYFCDEGYMLKGEYKYLTCKNGEWNEAMQVSCRLSPAGKDPHASMGMPTLSIVASTASSVALILLLVVLFVLLQPKLKSFQHTRGEAPFVCSPWSDVTDNCIT